jgi:DNA-binding NarL/FixJ family response regulator
LRVVLADDHHFFREGLRDVLTSAGMEVVGEATDGSGACAAARELAPDVIVIDLSMPDGSAFEPICQIARSSPGVQIVVLTVSAGEDDAIKALTAGACSYLLKDTRVDHLVAAIEQAAGGHAVLSREVVQALVARVSKDARPQPPAHGTTALTARELDVLRLIVEGADNAAIGQELSISRHTVKQYVTNILGKLGLQSRVQAAVYAVRAGLV